MTLRNVHLYRKMELFFSGIEAARPQEVAPITAGRDVEAFFTDGDGPTPNLTSAQ